MTLAVDNHAEIAPPQQGKTTEQSSNFMRTTLNVEKILEHPYDADFEARAANECIDSLVAPTTNRYSNDPSTIMLQKNKHTGPDQISKDKLWHTYQAVNFTTGRLNKTFMCNLCKKQFPKVSAVKAHLSSHLGVHPYACNLCNRTFVQKGNRDRHIQKQSCQR